ncbi:hypothetical protein ACM66Z_07515 [Sulfurovum sp. ST-21]|uniref:hypothetical protein n=1 Tax=Sulfurovum TaxID=265570 RepID=UPI001E336EB2|nr:hypothetical protein [Sulfurovum indicum]
MGRSRYKVYEPTHPHFVTCTVLHWLPLFTRKESVQIVIDSLRFLQKKDHFTRSISGDMERVTSEIEIRY